MQRWLIFSALAAMTAAPAPPSIAGPVVPPPHIRFQGVATDRAGQPITGPADFHIGYWSAATGGTLFLSEAHANVPVRDGKFTLSLGSGTLTPGTEPTLRVIFVHNDSVWLEVAVNSDPPMTPRLQMLTAPYAFRAMTADSVASPLSLGGATAHGTSILTVQQTGEGRAGYFLKGTTPGPQLTDSPALHGDGGKDIGVFGTGWYGVYGISDVTAGVGGTADSGAPYGVLGLQKGAAGIGVAGLVAGNIVPTPESVGVYGAVAPPADVMPWTRGAGVRGASNTVDGVQGGSISGYGVVGTSHRIGVYGAAQYDPALGWAPVGVYGVASPGGEGVLGDSQAGVGVGGRSTTGTGVWGATWSANPYYAGVEGNSVSGEGENQIDGPAIGVRGTAGTGIGVYGVSTGIGTGVKASTTKGSTALQIDNGAIRVTGAVKPAFIHAPTAQNTSNNVTFLAHPLLDGDPNAIVLVTPRVAGPLATPPAVGVYYDNRRRQWAISSSVALLDVSIEFNVLVLKQ